MGGRLLTVMFIVVLHVGHTSRIIRLLSLEIVLGEKSLVIDGALIVLLDAAGNIGYRFCASG
jgi:hypothetical protein